MMKLPKKIGYIGLGHIGGSIAKTIARIHPGIAQIAYDTNPDTLKKAVDEEIIETGYDSLDEAFENCDLIFLCAPVLENVEYVDQLEQLVVSGNPHTILTDVGSVKHSIHDRIRQYPQLEKHFIGGHPMCGTEHAGYDYSTAYMLENAYYVLTPTETVAPEQTEEMRDFIASIGALPIVLNDREHDHIVGSVSHLPHVISATLVNLVKDTDDANETMRTIAAGGFKDITRISSSSPDMWENICLANRDELLRLIDTYMASLQKSRERIASANGAEIRAFFQSAKDYRDSINLPHSGPLHPVFQIYCDLIDEAGGIATIATILATNNVNIKNIGIIHNREFEQGVLHIEFYSRKACDHAISLLKRHHYTVYET